MRETLIAGLLAVAAGCAPVAGPGASDPPPSPTATARPPQTEATPTVTATAPAPTPTTDRPPASPPQAATATQAPPTAAPTAPPPAPLGNLRLRPVFTGLAQPVFLTHAGDGSGDVYVVQRGGRIRVAPGGTLRAEPFLDITSIVGSSGSEQGLLGLAFHPNFRSNRYFYVNYTDRRGNTVIARYTAAPGRTAVDPASATVILSYDQPYPNHNGGMLAFGPDGKLWIGTGDGGSGGDPHGNGQNRNHLLGKMLRIDVDAREPYGIPPDNPFATQPDARPEVWATGLRNPWRYSFDRGTGDLWIADVGQNAWEEVNLVPAGSRGGLNFGWNRMEGSRCFPAGRQGCDTAGLELPVGEYGRNEGCSVTGGYVYRGRAFPALQGRYFFTDFCSGRLWSLERAGDGSWRRTERAVAGAGISSFGEDEAGELYVTNLNNGTVYQLMPE